LFQLIDRHGEVEQRLTFVVGAGGDDDALGRP
jgi:hypothetical protein